MFTSFRYKISVALTALNGIQSLFNHFVLMHAIAHKMASAEMKAKAAFEQNRMRHKSAVHIVLLRPNSMQTITSNEPKVKHALVVDNC